MQGDDPRGVERALGRIEERVDSIKATLPGIERKTDALTERLGAHERTTADRHRQNEARFGLLQASSDAGNAKLATLDKRLLAIEEPRIRAAAERSAWKRRWHRRAWWALGALGGLGTLAEPLYRAIAEPFARSAADYITRLFLRP